MTIQTATDETFQARLEADDQSVLWLLDAEGVGFQLALEMHGCGSWQVQ